MLNPHPKLILIMISRNKIEEFCTDNDIEIQFISHQDNAIIGLSTCFSEFKVVYSYLKIIERLKQEMSMEEAIEFFEFNIENSFTGNSTPVIIRDDIDWSEYDPAAKKVHIVSKR